MKASDHYHAAQRLLGKISERVAEIDEARSSNNGLVEASDYDIRGLANVTAVAQVHATLALAATAIGDDMPTDAAKFNPYAKKDTK